MTNFVEKLHAGQSGPRLAVKDTIDVAGIPTRCGTLALADAPPAPRHAETVARLLDAGYQLVGKTTLHELAFGVTGLNPRTGTAVNPIDPRRIPGGSSSGSAAAVGADEADLALGTDTGGSIRIPAACCGVVGLKPTFGRISRAGVVPISTTLDCVGPIARTVGDIMSAMVALDPSFRTAATSSVRIGHMDLPAHPAIGKAIGAVLADAGLSVEALAPPPSMEAAFEAGLTIINRETFAAFGHLLESGLLGAGIAMRLKRGGLVSDGDIAAAEDVRARFRAEIDARLDRVDVIVLPTLQDFPPMVGSEIDDRSAMGLTAYVRPFNLSGHPALSLPVPTAAGFPAGLQIVARRGEDGLLCDVARRLEAVAQRNSISGEVSYV